MNKVIVTIDTLRGPLPLADLRVVESREKVPCGDCVTTQYFLGEEKVRQDVRVEVDPTVITGFAGV